MRFIDRSQRDAIDLESAPEWLFCIPSARTYDQTAQANIRRSGAFRLMGVVTVRISLCRARRAYYRDEPTAMASISTSWPG